eukprot:gnl/MRDRNA2_/MRDRNA2_82777_c0_seq4.p1 gnl/MRDRNA2_/MRDRNA2_82777_c0~~gnl/MRDRNA2_/MRDRNA2_82777_c0_seq4.p1  ORF type:complete len:473 (+),score=49.20 gnl/MRDRNA2_/MRDRNA2_82777_c0_seq4:166-1419(+)
MASRFGRKRVLVSGVCCISISTFLFGLVEDMLPGSALKVWTCMYGLLRALQGIGAALANTCIFAILTDAFPNDKGKVIGVANSMNGLGWAVGPPVGGLIFAAGGFRLPFMVMAPIPMLLLLFQLLSFPELNADTTSDAAPAEHLKFSESFQRSRQLVTRPMLLTALVAVVYIGKWAFFDMTFTPWASAEFGFSITTVSLYFSIPAICFVVCAPLGGCAVDKVKHKKWLLAAGLCVDGSLTLCYYQLSWLLWPMEVRLMVMMPYLICLGVFGSLVEPVILPDMLESAAPATDSITDAQQQDVQQQQQAPVPQKPDEHTTNLITSMFTTSWNLGGIVGPQFAYLVVPQIGVRGTVSLLGALLIFLAVSLLLYQLISSRSAMQYVTLSQHTREVATSSPCSPQKPTTIGSIQMTPGKLEF